MKAFFLDFDGVIVDSIAECYTVSKQAFFGFTPLPVQEQFLKTLFYKYRGLVGPVYQYLILLRTMQLHNYRDDGNSFTSDFYNLNLKISEEEKNHFESIFFVNRKLNQLQMDSWLKQNPLTEFGRSLVGNKLEHVYIVTTKDRLSVKVILEEAGIIIKDIFDKEDFKKHGCKGQIIKQIMDDDLTLTEGIFLDDSVEHLNSVKDKRIECFFANWGYGKNTDYPLYPESLYKNDQ